jgi:hypothetical protein
MTTETVTKSSSTQINVWVDLALFTAIMLTLSPFLTGMTIHEWLGLGLGVGILVHLLLHWQWVVAVIRRFFGQLTWSARINLILNSLLFIDLTIIIFTGIMISREALPLFGISLEGGRVWEGLHRSSADLSLFLAGLHVAVHWKWILNAIQRYILAPIFKLGRAPAPQPTPAPIFIRSEVKR